MSTKATNVAVVFNVFCVSDLVYLLFRFIDESLLFLLGSFVSI